MGTTLVWTEQDWCHCFSSTVGRGKALGQAVCLSGVVGRLREASGGLTPSAVAPLLSSSVARRLGGCRERRVSGQTPPMGDVGGTERATSGPAVPSAVPTLFLHPMLGLHRPAPPPQGMLGHGGVLAQGGPRTHHKHKLEAFGGWRSG